MLMVQIHYTICITVNLRVTELRWNNGETQILDLVDKILFDYMQRKWNLGPKTKATAIQIGKPANMAERFTCIRVYQWSCVIQVSDKEMLDGMSVVGSKWF